VLLAFSSFSNSSTMEDSPGSLKPEHSDLEVCQGSSPTALKQGYGIEVYNESATPEAAWIETDPTTGPIARPSSKDGKILSGVLKPPDEGDKELPPPAPAKRNLKPVWIVLGVAIVAGAIGGGVGGHIAARNHNHASSSSDNLGITALRWIDGANISHYRVYHQQLDQTQILESSWNSDDRTWTVSSIADASVDIKQATPLTSSAGYPHTNVSNALVKNVYFVQPPGTVIERQSPYKEAAGVWGNDNFSGLYTASNASSLFSYWYQNFDTSLQVLSIFFQELGANSLTVAKYVQNATHQDPWRAVQYSLSIQDGSSIAAAPVGSRRDLRLYVGGTDGTLRQYPYNIETDVLGAVTGEWHPNLLFLCCKPNSGAKLDTAFDITPHTPLCVTIEDNRNYYTDETLPECAQTNAGAFITHLILFASPDRSNLTLVSWNCSSGFVMAQNRIQGLLRPNRTYLGLATTSASNLTFDDNRVYVVFDEGNGPEVEEWQVPASGGSNGRRGGQNGPWTRLGSVPITA
jgi:hypothetical protein